MAKLVVGVNDLATRFPEIASEWNYEMNDGVTPQSISYGSPRKVWWVCPKYGHPYEMSVGHRTGRNSSCPYCSGKKVLAGFNDLATLRPDLLAEWDDSNDIRPDEVALYSGKVVSWRCGKCGHVWKTAVSCRTRGNTGCPKCGRERIAAARRRPRDGHSLADEWPDVAAEWNYEKNGDLTPFDVRSGSGKKVWWLCSEGHEWEATIYSRTNRRQQRGCPYCGRKALLTGFNDLATRYPQIAKQWHPTKNAGKTPSDVTSVSKYKAWWIGECGHEWQATVSNRVLHNTGCPICDNVRRISFPEKAVFYYVAKAHDDALENYRPEIDGIGRMNFDIWIPSIRTAIEYDGEISHADSARDKKKDSVCASNGIRLIRIRDVGCPDYDDMPEDVIHRESPRNHKTLTRAIGEVMDAIWSPTDVDIERDATDIYRMMHLTRIRDSICVTHPHVAAEWNDGLNEGLSPWMFSYGSKFKAWWTCPDCNESYEMSIAERCVSKCRCPKCRGRHISESKKRPKPGRSLAEKSPDIASEWDYERNDGLTPMDVYNGSGTKVWWTCGKCGHSWETPVKSRGVNGTGCPKCHKEAKAQKALRR